MTVSLMPVAADRRTISSGPQNRTLTDGDGNFKFTGLAPRVYSVSASTAKGYVPKPAPVSEMQDSGSHRIGDNVTITLIKGGAITGRVTNALGEPLISVQVNAAMVRGTEGNTDREGGRPFGIQTSAASTASTGSRLEPTSSSLAIDLGLFPLLMAETRRPIIRRQRARRPPK